MYFKYSRAGFILFRLAGWPGGGVGVGGRGLRMVTIITICECRMGSGGGFLGGAVGVVALVLYGFARLG